MFGHASVQRREVYVSYDIEWGMLERRLSYTKKENLSPALQHKECVPKAELIKGTVSQTNQPIRSPQRGLLFILRHYCRMFQLLRPDDAFVLVVIHGTDVALRSRCSSINSGMSLTLRAGVRSRVEMIKRPKVKTGN
jgi:hypothetical protein